MVKVYKPSIAVTDEDRLEYHRNKYGGVHLKEEFKGEVLNKEVKFPKALGVEHPFDFAEVENVSKNFGVLDGIIDKYVDSIVGDFTIKVKSAVKHSKDELSDVKIPKKVKGRVNQEANAEAIITDFLDTTNFSIHLRAWIREGIMKGNGFMELDFNESKLRVLNSNQIYIQRNKKGKIIRYNQWVGDLKRLTRTIDKNSIIDLGKDRIAHLPINLFAGDAYGMGFVFPNLTTLNFLMGNEVDVHKMITRKAGSPIHVKLGQPGAAVQQADIDDFKSKLQFMQTRTEWVTDGDIEMKVLEFGQLGKSITETIQHDLFMLASGMQVPEVLMGSGQLNEGIAKTQLEGWDRKISSIQEAIESIIEEKIFKPILESNGFSEKVEFIWNLPGEEEINKRIERLIKLLSGSMDIDENLRRMAQIELARLNDFSEEDINTLRPPEFGLDDKKEEEDKEEQKAQQEAKMNPERKKEEEKIAQPEVPGAKPNANQKNSALLNTKHVHSHMCGEGCGQQLSESETSEMTVKEWVDLKEFEKFNYQDYLLKILQQVKNDKFSLLAATSELELAEGLLPPNEIEKLRVILKNGFRKNQTIRDIQKEIESSVNLNDRLKDGKLVAKAGSRPNSIARTETVRLANQGLLNHYKDNKIEKVRFLAALSERTCPICEDLNSQVFTLNESDGIIPVHTMCRCSWTPVI